MKVQGYEHLALNYLINKKGVNPDRIECGSTNKNIPTIHYFFDGMARRYYPDMFIPDRNLLVEVKSTFTYKMDLERNLAKKRAAKAQGYSFRFLIMNPDGSRHYEK